MEKIISYMMNTITNPMSESEMWNMVSDADFRNICAEN